MMNFKSNKGITLVVLIITIIVLLILAGITINTGKFSLDNTKISNEKSELLMIQHAIYERYVEYIETNNKAKLIGIEAEELIEEKDYEAILDKEKLELLGITMKAGSIENDSQFKVNYETGYVKKVGSSLELKGYNINEVGEKTSNEISITN